MRRLREIIRKEFLQLKRDKRLLPILFVAPVMQLALLGYAATTDLKDVPVAVANLDRSRASTELLRSFSVSGDFDLRYDVDSPADLDYYLDANLADIAIVIPSDYGERVHAGRSVQVQVLVDGTKVNAATALGHLSRAIGRYAEGLVAERLATRGLVVRRPEVGAVTRVWYNPELSSRNFMVPGVMALVLMVITMIVTSMAIVKERESGTMEQIVVTPIRPMELIGGKLVPYFLIGVVESLLVLAVAVLWFEVPLRGNAALLIALALLFMVNAQGLGLFISTISHTQQQSMMTAMFFVMLPMVMLSGFVFPIENMPQPIQYITYLMPLRYFLVILRGIFLKGVGLDVLWPQVAALAVFGGAILTLSALRFQKRID